MRFTKIKGFIPEQNTYQQLIRSAVFKEMEAYSNAFLEQHEGALKEYAVKWVADPLHQWSRQWEYPYCYEVMSEHFKQLSSIPRVLDAGSGVTFFPYLLAQDFGAKVEAIDYDPKLAGIYNQINNKSERPVNFGCEEIGRLSFSDESFDAVYCISVLEHTDNYAQAIDEFWRVLKPKGKLILTFDISIDGNKDIPVHKANDLIGLLSEKFGETALLIPNPIDEKKLVTTRFTYKLNRHLLPWDLSISKRNRMVERLLPFYVGAKFPALTFYCMTLTKAGQVSKAIPDHH